MSLGGSWDVLQGSVSEFHSKSVGLHVQCPGKVLVRVFLAKMRVEALVLLCVVAFFEAQGADEHLENFLLYVNNLLNVVGYPNESSKNKVILGTSLLVDAFRF